MSASTNLFIIYRIFFNVRVPQYQGILWRMVLHLPGKYTSASLISSTLLFLLLLRAIVPTTCLSMASLKKCALLTVNTFYEDYSVNKCVISIVHKERTLQYKLQVDYSQLANLFLYMYFFKCHFIVMFVFCTCTQNEIQLNSFIDNT